MVKLALFASGSGSNVKNIIEYFSDKNDVEVVLVCSNKVNAGALDHAKNAEIDYFVFNKQEFNNTELVEQALDLKNVDFVVLAGFLLMVPEKFIAKYSDKIVNVHPSLLPKFGGKGMYGANVHKAVAEAKETESGITIHLVNEKYDDGRIAFQAIVDTTGDDASQIEAKVRALEIKHFPRIIHKLVKNEI